MVLIAAALGIGIVSAWLYLIRKGLPEIPGNAQDDNTVKLLVTVLTLEAARTRMALELAAALLGGILAVLLAALLF